ncbi:MAG: hypothetical protein R6U84_04705 [Candidatus Cloacimonadales bacterium]
MLNPKVEKFLEENNFTYLYLLLANLEAERLSNLPYSVRKNFTKKLTSMALDHIAANEIPDYIVEEMGLLDEEE